MTILSFKVLVSSSGCGVLERPFSILWRRRRLVGGWCFVQGGGGQRWQPGDCRCVKPNLKVGVPEKGGVFLHEARGGHAAVFGVKFETDAVPPGLEGSDQKRVGPLDCHILSAHWPVVQVPQPPPRLLPAAPSSPQTPDASAPGPRTLPRPDSPSPATASFAPFRSAGTSEAGHLERSAPTP